MSAAMSRIWVDVQRAARMEAAAQCQAVKEAKALAQEALRVSGIDDAACLRETGKVRHEDWSTAGYFEAAYAGLSAQDAARKLLDRAREAILREVRSGFDLVKSLREEMDEALGQREQAELDSQDIIREAEQEMLDRLAEFDLEHSATDRGCMAAAGFGCGVVCLGVVAQVVLASLGQANIIQGPVVHIGLAVASMPIVLMIMAQIVQGANRASLESQLRQTVNQARQRAEQAVRMAEAAYRRQHEALRGQLAEAEADYRKVAAGLAVLGVPIPESLQIETPDERSSFDAADAETPLRRNRPFNIYGSY